MMMKGIVSLLAAATILVPGLVQAAELSGKVVVYCPSPAKMADKLAEGFTKKTGVKVEMFQGTTGEIMARLEAERANPVADVVIMASWPDGLAMKEKGLLASYAPVLSDRMVSGWKDEDNMLFGTSASAVGVLYNTRLVPELSADWGELARPEFKDMLALPDPVKSGSCKDFLSGFMYAFGEDKGWKVWEDLAAQGMTIPGANKAALEAVITGEKAVLIAGVDYNAFSSAAKGEPLAIYYPKSGTVVNPRPAMILKSSRNMENARAYMDYLLSDEAQQMVCDAYLLPGRADVKNTNRTALSDIRQLDVNWDWMMEHSTDIATRMVKMLRK